MRLTRGTAPHLRSASSVGATTRSGFPEAHGRDPLIGASWILANTTMLKVATGVANIYARDSLATVNAQYALAEQSEDVFCLELEYRTSLLLKDFAVISTKNRSLR